MTENLLITEISEKPNVTIGNKPDDIPAKFWDAEKQAVRTEALLQSYIALEKRMSRMVALPESDEDRKRLQKVMGCPDCAEDYQVTLKSDIIEIDPDLNTRLHAKGFTNDQVQEIYDLAVEKMIPMVLGMAAEFQADREIERLIEKFGGAEKWNTIAKQLQEYGKKNLPAAAFEGLSCSYDGVMALYNMMKNNIKSPMARDGGASFDALDESALKKMMQDPKYWRDRDPSFIARVSEGFQRLYGDGKV